MKKLQANGSLKAVKHGVSWYFSSMSAVEEIKAATAALDPDEQYELFRWWVESNSFKQRQLAALKRAIAAGIEDLEQGRYQTYTAAGGDAVGGGGWPIRQRAADPGS